MGVKIYIMHRDLQDLRANWRTKAYMLSFVQMYPNIAEYKCDDMVSDFLNIVEHRMKTYLLQWRKQYFPFVIGWYVLSAAYIAI